MLNHTGEIAMLGHDGLRTLRVEEAAEILGVHAETIRRWVREGQLRAARWGGRLHLTAEAVREFQAACQVHVPDPADFIRRARSGKARGGGRRTARRGGPLSGQSGRAAAGSQPGGAAQPGAAARFSPEQPAVSASAEGPAPAIR